MRQKFFSMEAIDFQSDAFFLELAQAFEELWACEYSSSYQKLVEQPQAVRILELIYRRFGLKVVYDTEYQGMAGPAIMPTMINPNVIFYDNNYREYPEYYEWFRKFANENKKKLISGTIDLKRGRIEGEISELESTLYMPASMMRSGQWEGLTLSSKEVAAIVCHELGHSWTFLEVLCRVNTTNLVLDYLSKNKAAANPEQIKLALGHLANKNLLSSDQANALADAENDQDTAIIAYGIVHDRIRSELGIDIYDRNACEQSADQFATRLGAGIYVIRALEKVGGLEAYKHRHRLGWVGEMLTILGTIGLLSILIPIAGFIFGASYITAVLLAIFVGEPYEGGYDLGHWRPRRVMQDMIHRLKDTKLSPREKAALIEHIEELEKLIDTKGTEDLLVEKIARLFSSSYRKKSDFQKLQKDLEQIGSNKLYVHAAKIHELARED
jgi:hypothetical protein